MIAKSSGGLLCLFKEHFLNILYWQKKKKKKLELPFRIKVSAFGRINFRDESKRLEIGSHHEVCRVPSKINQTCVSAIGSSLL